MLEIALFEPQIAPNTGNIMRLVANNGARLHLIEPLGFDLDEKKLRRAGLDYRDVQNLTLHPDISSFFASMADHRIFAITTKGTRHYTEAEFNDNDVLLFGAETHGLSAEAFAGIGDSNWLRIPMQENNRSMNLSNAVAVVSYEAWRQLGFIGGQ
ncbi:MAG: tRNA (cytidine(34)-2'-O)-methyltransferase [Gammaproteobacteria bacterium]|nr:tRNA (cytidine(34)-2'-O)-methyltransferase [Gammaproteobacteria bacterium]NNJ72587.1 tRNA (cytidine(34)-2'-O)-methyltransferase [Enterobacterales bacterium]